MSITRLFATGLCLLSFFAKSEPLYWQATNGDTTFMLIGSIHLGDESMYPLPEPVMEFLTHSDGLIVEADLSANNGIQYPTTKITTKEALDATQQQKLVDIAVQVGIDINRLNLAAPWAAALTLQVGQVKQLGYQAELGIDQYLIHQAQISEVPILGLETLQHQIDLLANLDHDGTELLISTLDSWDEANHSLPCLFKSWTAGDKRSLIAVTEESETPDEVTQKLAAERNHQWVKKLTSDTFLPKQQGKYLVAVGALHLIGNENLLSLLEQNGYQIKQLSRSEQASCLVQ